MSTVVQAVLHEPGLELPLEIQEWQMYEVPEAGSHYWHGRSGYVVQRIDRTDPITVHFVRDPAWEEELHNGLPDEYIIDGGRRVDDGEWHFSVVGPDGRLNRAWSFGPDQEIAIRDAIQQVRALLEPAS
jgi:hypothetical protein